MNDVSCSASHREVERAHLEVAEMGARLNTDISKSSGGITPY